MCHNRTKNNKINKLVKDAYVYCIRTTNILFHGLLEKDTSVSIHDSILRALATKMYSVLNGMAQKIVTEIFPFRVKGQYNLRNWSHLTLLTVETANYGIESIRYLGLKIWESIPANIKISRYNRAF